ncbi:MAG: sulfurtransferase TusA family protein [Planctomycetes bacterium]|nr:sulfurtransferase TusA family protein [Planctomycetota bacterium]
MERTVIDCKGLKCPLPIVQLALAIKDLPAGSEVCIEATDPAFLPDLRAWAEVSGNTVAATEEGEVKRTTIRKKAGGQ